MAGEESLVRVEQSPKGAVARVLREELIEDATVLQVEEELLTVVFEHPGKNMVLDLGRVRLLSSGLLGALLRVKEELSRQGGRLVLCGVHRKVTNTPDDKYLYELLKVVKLDTVFEICESVEEALLKLDVAE